MSSLQQYLERKYITFNGCISQYDSILRIHQSDWKTLTVEVNIVQWDLLAKRTGVNMKDYLDKMVSHGLLESYSMRAGIMGCEPCVITLYRPEEIPDDMKELKETNSEIILKDKKGKTIKVIK